MHGRCHLQVMCKPAVVCAPVLYVFSACVCSSFTALTSTSPLNTSFWAGNRVSAGDCSHAGEAVVWRADAAQDSWRRLAD